MITAQKNANQIKSQTYNPLDVSNSSNLDPRGKLDTNRMRSGAAE